MGIINSGVSIMDEQIRAYAKQCVEQAVALKNSFHSNELVMQMYLQGINCYSQIVNKTREDLATLNELSHDVAVFYFNEGDSVNAEHFYATSINYLQQMDECNIKEIDAGVDVILKNLSISQRPKRHTFFSFNDARKDPGDESYRATADGFLRVARAHVNNGSINAALVAYKQAVGALSFVQCRHEQDRQKIEALNEQIAHIQIKLRQLKRSAPEEVDEEEIITHDMAH
jgi:hypothetical protein